VLDEPFEARLLVGGALTAAGIAAVNRKPRARIPAPSVLSP
jgi:drug/metabolite transporter (DMT)-like permease